MDLSPFKDWDESAWIALGGAIIAMVGTIYNIGMKRHAKRSALAAKKSAEAAERAAEQATRVADLDAARWHQEMAPPHPGDLRISPRREEGSGRWGLYVTIHLPRGYRVRGETIFKNSAPAQDARGPLNIGLYERGPADLDLHIESSEGSEDAYGAVIGLQRNVKAVHLRFWPPLETDEAGAWVCPCGGPTGDNGTGQGHWEMILSVTL
ncbi:hypothetical protein [Herbidospora cretacea]|uniref:hypothetical protein n=1 Tax=Herbidospora cretacea TaxID=28444 RepID=UPI0012FC8876|nr:hypothetical protein [Herbidospora cretacea]